MQLSQEKAQFVQAFLRFLRHGFSQEYWTMPLYETLVKQKLFGHLPYYHAITFYQKWFSTPQKRAFWLQYAAMGGVIRSGAMQWSDVELIIMQYIEREYSL